MTTRHTRAGRTSTVSDLSQTGDSTPRYVFPGHETFPRRYAWLPKAVRGVSENPRLFSDEDQAMVHLGVGKNMVRAIRFWAVAARVIGPGNGAGQAALYLFPLPKVEYMADFNTPGPSS